MKNLIYFFALVFISFINVYPQNPKWLHYNNQNSNMPANQIESLSIDNSGNIYMGLYQNGVTIFDGTNWKIFTKDNSALPDDDVRCVQTDLDGNLWVGMFYGGLAEYDGSKWSVKISGVTIKSLYLDKNGVIWCGMFNQLTSFNGTDTKSFQSFRAGFPSGNILAILSDNSNNIWISIEEEGLAKYDGSNWELFNENNSGLPDNNVAALATDNSGNIWIGTGRYNEGAGLVKYDGTNWTVYNTTNSGLPDNSIKCLQIDANNNIWIGTYSGGLAKYSGSNWTIFNKSNSGLYENLIASLAMDNAGNLIIADGGDGLTIYNENGVVSVEEENNHPRKFYLYQNYPNPFNPTTTIKYSIPKTSNVELKVFDILGREVAELVNEEKPAGNYTLNFNASKLSSGIYFYRIKAGSYTILKN